MPETWYIGDLHFSHSKLADLRGFSSVEAHNQHIINKWNKQVRSDDRVFVMGDISSGGKASENEALDILKNLPGEKHLISGNHDSCSSIHRNGFKNHKRFSEAFESIRDYGRIRIDGTAILLSHYPYWSQGDGIGRAEPRYAQYLLPDLGDLLIHAHTHHSDPFASSKTGREMCVSWEAWNRLVSTGDIVQWMKNISQKDLTLENDQQ